MASNNMNYDQYYINALRQILLYRIRIEQLYCYEVIDDSW